MRLATTAVIVTMGAIGLAGQTPAIAPGRDAGIAAAKSIIAKARYATLVTVGEDGQPEARIVDPFAPEGDLTIWLATNARSRKVVELRANPRATLLYFDSEGLGYASLQGRAELVSAPAEKAKRWKDDWKGFYADANRGPDYLLIRVVPDRLELSAPSRGMNNDPATWKPVTIDLRPKKD